MLLEQLGAVERRANELLQTYMLGRPGSSGHPALAELLHGCGGGGTPAQRIVVEPPSSTDSDTNTGPAAIEQHGGITDDVLPEDVPLCRAQLQAKACARLRCGYAIAGTIRHTTPHHTTPHHTTPHHSGCPPPPPPPPTHTHTRAHANTHAQVARGLDAVLERGLRVRPAGAGACGVVVAGTRRPPC